MRHGAKLYSPLMRIESTARRRPYTRLRHLNSRHLDQPVRARSNGCPRRPATWRSLADSRTARGRGPPSKREQSTVPSSQPGRPRPRQLDQQQQADSCRSNGCTSVPASQAVPSSSWTGSSVAPGRWNDAACRRVARQADKDVEHPARDQEIARGARIVTIMQSRARSMMLTMPWAVGRSSRTKTSCSRQGLVPVVGLYHSRVDERAMLSFLQDSMTCKHDERTAKVDLFWTSALVSLADSIVRRQEASARLD